MRTVSTLLLLSGLCACGEPAQSGLDEPLRITAGAFKAGELPGTPAKGSDTDAKIKPQVTAIVSLPSVLRPSSSELPFEARATPDAYAIGIRFTKLGSGYWVFPLSEPDVVNHGELTWRASASVGAAIEPGNYEIELVAFDQHGHAGLKRTRSVCVLPPFDDNLNTCDPSLSPPAFVISLAWAVDMDLDLRVRTPSGKLVDAKHPSTAALDAGLEPDAGPSMPGFIDHDSNADCTIDSQRRESLLFQDPPEPGRYSVYVNVFDACGKSASEFEVATYARADGKREGTFRLAAASSPIRGEVLGASANGGAMLGTFVETLRLP